VLETDKYGYEYEALVKQCGRKTKALRVKPVPVPPHLQQISWGLAWDKTQSSEVRHDNSLNSGMAFYTIHIYVLMPTHHI
jgi:hypothetical protein